MIVKVECAFTIDVEVADGLDPVFVIEDNGCPGTGPVWATLRKHIMEHEKTSTCWACALGGKNKIICVRGKHDFFGEF